MKTSLLVLGITAVVAAPLFSVQADGMQPKKTVASDAKQMAAVPHREREYFYITNASVTGSNIPVVVTRYKGVNTTSSPFVAYDQADISATGALSVGDALVKRDPAISFSRGH